MALKICGVLFRSVNSTDVPHSGVLKTLYFYLCKLIETIFAKNHAKNNEKRILLETSDAWSKSDLSQQTSEPAYYIVDCRISRRRPQKKFTTRKFPVGCVLKEETVIES